jgi:hypothetical protein
MARAKKIHEVLIPRRHDEIKGVYFSNKYAAGDGGGGEFYDLLQSHGKVFQIMVSSQSYLISSSLLGLLAKHKQKDFDPLEFIKDAEAVLIALIDRIRMLDNDLIRLNQKVETVMELRGKTIEKERIEADKDINQTKRKEDPHPPVGKRKATAQEIKDSAGD